MDQKLRRRLVTARRRLRSSIAIEELAMAQPENVAIAHLCKDKIERLRLELAAVEEQLERALG